MSDSSISLYLPQKAHNLSQTDLWRWFQNIPRELSLLPLSGQERASFEDYYRGAGLLKQWRQPFFRHHYALPLCRAVQAIFDTGVPPRILDLGCGSGTQALLFALMGAEVVAVDMDVTALAVLEKRKLLYEQYAGHELKITVRNGDVFKLDFNGLSPFGAVYSLFAFNMMQPTQELLRKLQPHLASDAIIAIQDGNRAHFFNRLFRRRKNVASRDELRAWLQVVGFHDVEHIGGYAIPPLLWRIAPARLLAPIDEWFTRCQLLAVSYLHVARRGTRSE